MPHAYLDMHAMVKAIEIIYAESLSGTGLNPLEALILLTLKNAADPMRASDVAAAVHRAPTSFTPVLDSLEREGLIQRAPVKADRRAVHIELSAKGMEKAKRVTPLLHAAHKAAEAVLTDPDSGVAGTFMVRYAPVLLNELRH